MNKGNKLYEGKAKIIYETKDKNSVIQHFKDDATAFNNLKKASVEGKGVLNNRISEYIFMDATVHCADFPAVFFYIFNFDICHETQQAVA